MLSEDQHERISEDWQEHPMQASPIALSSRMFICNFTLFTGAAAAGQPNVICLVCGCARRGSLVPGLGLLSDCNGETSLLNTGEKGQSGDEKWYSSNGCAEE